MKGLKAALVIWGVLAASFVSVLTAQAAEMDCRTVSSHLVNRPDNGHGTPAVWALDTMTRTVKVCHPPEVAPAAAKVPVDTWIYTAELADEGTFVTQGGPTNSPNAGTTLTTGVHGTVSGAATFVKFAALHDWGYWTGDVLNGKTFGGTDPSGTGDWIKNLWSDGFSGTKIATYKWTYKTCSEQWVDSSEEANGDGTADAAGDITGKPCPSSSASPSPSSSVSAAPVADRPTLPVTGPGGRTQVMVALGGGLVLSGGVLILAIRRRRPPKFIA